MLTRRQAILSAAALLPQWYAHGSVRGDGSYSQTRSILEHLASRLPDYDSFPGLAAIRDQTHRLQAKQSRWVSIRRLGKSRGGEPIELISVGKGRRSALVVAGVHANEPVGSLTAAFLMEQLASDEGLRTELDYTWHFINPIDPDGMQLNEGWFGRPPLPRAYFHDFARPALSRQPDYTFPLRIGSYSFSESSPENIAFRAAIDLTKPDFQYTLHNAEYGGAFFLASEAFPELERQLQALPRKFGIALNNVGEPLSDLAVYAAGVFALPQPAQLLKTTVEAGGADPHTFWSAGDSSTAYAKRYGTFSFSAEVPYWDDPRTFDHRASEFTLGQVLKKFLPWAAEAAEILDRWAPKLMAQPPTANTETYYYALKEYLTLQPVQFRRLHAVLDAGLFDAKALTVAEQAFYDVTMRLTLIRPIANLLRLNSAGTLKADVALPEAALSELGAYCDRLLQAAWPQSPPRSIPIRCLVGIQAISGVIAAHMLAERKR